MAALAPAVVRAQIISADDSSASPSIGSSLPATESETPLPATSPQPDTAQGYRLTDFFNHFAPYEPMYVVGWPTPDFKMQFSLRYQLLTPTGPLATKYPMLDGINFAYTQQVHGGEVVNSGFTYDNDYCPETFYDLRNVLHVALPTGWHFDAQVGADHESNGQKSPDHRSLNVVYVRPILDVGTRNGWFFLFEPKIYYYVGGLSLNPDMPYYRGYCDLRLVVGQRDGLQLSTLGRVGSHFNRGSAQLDLTYPLTKPSRHNLDILIDAQYFVGDGDTLRTYNQRTSIFRLGVATVR